MSAKAKLTTAAATTKDVIYIDVDDEITAIIDKTVGSPHKIIALVLPKRSTVLQSVVNMKLLKRSADEANKNVVLITNESGLLPLAGSVGLYVAPTPQSKPVIPNAPQNDEDLDADDAPVAMEAPADEFDPSANAAVPIGALAAVDETIELDNADKTIGLTENTTKTKKTKKNSKLKVPNFNKFRLSIVLGILAVLLLIGGWVMAATVLPQATITISTDSEEIEQTVDLTLDTAATAVNVDDGVVPAVRVQSIKTTTQQAAASGSKNLGEKAEGSVVITICSNDPDEVNDVPAGTGVSTGGKTYITQKKASFTGSGTCNGKFRWTSNSVDITAQAGGADYNVDNATFTVAGNSVASGKGSADGGTDNVVKVVSQADIDKATQALAAADDTVVSDELESSLIDQDLFAITDSLNKNTPEVTASAKAGDQVDSVTVTQKVTYNMMGAKQADLDTLINGLVEDEIDPERQTVLETGLDDAEFGLQSQQNDSNIVVVSMKFTAVAGPELDEAQIKEEAAGKKGGAVEEALLQYPGVTAVEVEYSPFWVSAVPSNTEKITIKFEN